MRLMKLLQHNTAASFTDEIRKKVQNENTQPEEICYTAAILPSIFHLKLHQMIKRRVFIFPLSYPPDNHHCLDVLQRTSLVE